MNEIFIIDVKYVVPNRVGSKRKLHLNNEKEVSFVKDGEETLFTDVSEVRELIVEIYKNRENYKHLVKGSSYLELWVKKIVKTSTGTITSYDDMVSIIF